MTQVSILEPTPEPGNPIGMDGIEFIEYATSQPQALGSVLQSMGFVPVARHRSREVTLYRQGTMNLIVNAHPDALPGMSAPKTTPELKAIALRVRDAGFAWKRSLDLGAWEMPTRASAMELNIPGIHGVGDSLIYFVDRYRDFSIYDVDFVPLPGVESRPLALAGLHYFGVMPKGTLLESPCGKFYLQLVEPPPGAQDIHWDEGLVRIGLGAPDVRAATRVLKERGVVFIDRGSVQPSEKGALTQVYLGNLTFELVVSHLKQGKS